LSDGTTRRWLIHFILPNTYDVFDRVLTASEKSTKQVLTANRFDLRQERWAGQAWPPQALFCELASGFLSSPEAVLDVKSK
jgi:hypothetical protein